MRKKKSPTGVGIEEVLEKHKELLDQIKFEDETQKRIFAICEEVHEMPHSVLPRIGHLLNSWEWADELPGKPDGWDEMSIYEKRTWVPTILSAIEIEVGWKAILRYAHKTEHGVTDQEFDDWWDDKSKNDLKETYYDTCKGYHRCDNERPNEESVIRTCLIYLCGFVSGLAISVTFFSLIG